MWTERLLTLLLLMGAATSPQVEPEAVDAWLTVVYQNEVCIIEAHGRSTGARIVEADFVLQVESRGPSGSVSSAQRGHASLPPNRSIRLGVLRLGVSGGVTDVRLTLALPDGQEIERVLRLDGDGVPCKPADSGDVTV